jgi:hypothetical protein
MNKENKKWITALIIIAAVGFLIYSVGFGRGSQPLLLCKNTYGAADNIYDYSSGSFMDYTIGANEVTHGENTYTYTYPRSTAASPACGVLTHTNGTTEPFGSRRYFADWGIWYGCPEGAKNFPLGFKDGELIFWQKAEGGNTLDYSEAEIIVENCYTTQYGYECSFQLGIASDAFGVNLDPTIPNTTVQFSNAGSDLSGELFLDYRILTPLGEHIITDEYIPFVVPSGGTDISADTTGFAGVDMKVRYDVTAPVSGFVTLCSYGQTPVTEIELMNFDSGWETLQGSIEDGNETNVTPIIDPPPVILSPGGGGGGGVIKKKPDEPEIDWEKLAAEQVETAKKEQQQQFIYVILAGAGAYFLFRHYKKRRKKK